jgi:hypothetical protein
MIDIRPYYSLLVKMRVPRGVYDAVQESWPVGELSTEEDKAQAKIVVQSVLDHLGVSHVIPGALLVSIKEGRIGQVELTATTFTLEEVTRLREVLTAITTTRGWVIETCSIEPFRHGDA